MTTLVTIPQIYFVLFSKHVIYMQPKDVRYLWNEFLVGNFNFLEVFGIALVSC